LLKWAVPINPEKTLSHLMNILYNKICLRKVPQLQTNEYIQFRSRTNFHTFPFDLTTFKTCKPSTLTKKDDKITHATESANRFILPLNTMRRLKYDSHHIFEVEFASPSVIVTDMRIFLGITSGGAQADGIQYKLIIKAFGEGSSDSQEALVYFNTFEEQIFAQFASTGQP
jgi:hypothetical protein